MPHRPKPTKLKILEGNPGKRPLPTDEPQPQGVPECPASLDAVARAEWHRIAPELIRLGLLTAVDQETFACYCEAVSMLKAARREMKRRGVLSPARLVADAMLRQVRALGTEFGLTPSARSRMHVPGAQAEVDEFERFLDHA